MEKINEEEFEVAKVEKFKAMKMYIDRTGASLTDTKTLFYLEAVKYNRMPLCELTNGECFIFEDDVNNETLEYVPIYRVTYEGIQYDSETTVYFSCLQTGAITSLKGDIVIINVKEKISYDLIF